MFKSKTLPFLVKPKKSTYGLVAGNDSQPQLMSRESPSSQHARTQKAAVEADTEPKTPKAQTLRPAQIDGFYDYTHKGLRTASTSSLAIEPVTIDRLTILSSEVDAIDRALTEWPSLPKSLEKEIKQWGSSWRSKLDRLDFQRVKTAVYSLSPPSLTMDTTFQTEADSDEFVTSSLYDWEDEDDAPQEDLRTQNSTTLGTEGFGQMRRESLQLSLALPQKSPLRDSCFRELCG